MFAHAILGVEPTILNLFFPYSEQPASNAALVLPALELFVVSRALRRPILGFGPGGVFLIWADGRDQLRYPIALVQRRVDKPGRPLLKKWNQIISDHARWKSTISLLLIRHAVEP